MAGPGGTLSRLCRVGQGNPGYHVFVGGNEAAALRIGGCRTSAFELGSIVAERRLDEVAGRGGMGVVYRAWNLRLKRVEAVKVIAEQYARNQEFHERFERETEIAAAIDHPHVVTIYDCGDGPGGELFIAMRYVEGTTLKRLLTERHQLDPEIAAELIAQVASALDAAHALGLVHRDVKPENILLAGAENEYRAYLTDFGLAKRLSSETVLTSAGLMVGTLDYMAPEQAQGRPVDQRADVYALGATLFRALTGQVPFPGEQDVTKLLAKVRESPPAPSQIVPDLPRAFDAILGRALSRDPAERYPSAGDLARAAVAAASASSGVPTGIRPQPPSREFSAPVMAICENALAAVDEPQARSALQSVRKDLLAPMRLVIIGDSPSSAAKLASVLLGREVAESDEIELTPAVSVVPRDQGEAFVVLLAVEAPPSPDAVHGAVASALGGLPASAVNCVCVLAGEHPASLREAAAAAKSDVGALVSAVVPVSSAAGDDLQELWREIDGLQGRVDALRAQTALTALEELSFRDRSLTFLRDRVEAVRFEPQMHVLDLLDALKRCVAQDIELPLELLQKLQRLATGRSVGERLGANAGAGAPELARVALSEYRTWKAFENGSHASPSARRVAETVSRSLQLIARQAERGS